jgi:hypothetical protein
MKERNQKRIKKKLLSLRPLQSKYNYSISSAGSNGYDARKGAKRSYSCLGERLARNADFWEEQKNTYRDVLTFCFVLDSRNRNL